MVSAEPLYLPSGDFSGDGKVDLVFRNAATGANMVWFMGGICHASSAALARVPPGWHIAAVADFDRARCLSALTHSVRSALSGATFIARRAGK